MSQPSYRIALLVDSPDVAKWVRDLALWAKDHPAIDLAAIIVQAPRSDRFDKLLALEHRFLSRKKEYRPYTRLHSTADIAPVTVGTGESLGPADLFTIEEFELDAIVRCGRAFPMRAMFAAAKDGIVSVMTNADSSHRPAGFAEVLQGRPETPFTIERLRDGGDTREVLFEGSVATALLYGWNAIALQARAFPYLQTTLERLASGTAQPVEARGAEIARSSAVDLIAYGMRTARRSFGKTYRRMSGREFNFQVAVAQGAWSDCEMAKGTPIPNPPGAFLADPFTINVGGNDYLFVEEFPFDTRKGVISAYRIDGGEAQRIGVVLEKPYHLSFPFVFKHEGEIYMVPESSADRSVRLYKATDFPTGWTEVKVLLDDVAAVDTVLFEHDSRWWMVTTIQGEGPGLNNAELHAFHADGPLGDWTPHKLNPIVMDARKGRNGGFVRDAAGGPCRVAQVPGFTFYGAASAVYRIDELTPETYRESLVREVRPTFFAGLDGTHHIHSANGVTVYDFMRVERPRAAANMKANDDDARMAG